MEVNDCGFSFNSLEKKVLQLSGISFVNKKVTLQSINPISTTITHFKSKKNHSSANVTLQVGDLANLKGIYYVYQDLTIDSLLNLKNNNPEAYKNSGSQNITRLSFYIRSRWQKIIFKNARGIFTMSKWLADSLVNQSGLNPEKVHNVGGGLNIESDMQKYNLIKAKEKNKILFVGRAFYRKAGPLVVDAFKILKHKFKHNAELYIIGPENNPLLESVDGVFFIGDIGKNELKEYYQKCDIFCMPSHFEAYGLVFIEALSFGLPCIGRNEFAMKEFIKDGNNGCLIDYNDPNLLAIKMRDLLENEEIKNNVMAEVDKYRTEYTWDAVAERIKKVIEADFKDINSISSSIKQ